MKRKLKFFNWLSVLILFCALHVTDIRGLAQPSPDSLLFWKNQARHFLQIDSLNLARPYIERIRREDPKNLEGIFLEAEWLEKQGEIGRAIDLLKTAALEYPLNKEIYNKLGYLEYLRIKGKKTPTPSLKNLWISLTGEKRAINYLKKALELDSTYVEAQRNLALVYQNSQKDRYLEEAQELMQKIQEQVPESEEDLLTMGEIAYDLKQWDKAEKIFLKIVNQNPGHDRAFYYLSQLNWKRNQLERATLYFYFCLRNLRDPDLLNDLFWDFRIIASADELKAYEAAEDKAAFLLRFWQSKDPSPATVVNEFLIEFFRRVEFARQHFPSAAYRGYDDRGVIYIRYGEPDERFIDPSDEPQIYRDSETWVYRKLAPTDVIFDFVRIGSDYIMVDNLFDVIRVGERNAYQIMRLLEKRERLSSIFARYHAQFQNIVARGEITDLEQLSPMDPRSMSLLNEMDREIDQGRSQAPVVFFPQRFENLTVYLNSGYFKAGSLVRYEIYFAVPYSELKFEKNLDSLATQLKFVISIQDSLYNLIKNISWTKDVRVGSEADLTHLFYVDQMVAYLQPGEYHITFEAENSTGNKKFRYRYGIRLPVFARDQLSMSSIQISPSVTLKTEREPTSQMALKEAFYIVPYPFVEVPRKKPFYVYFEIYNLQPDASGRVNYQVEYQVRNVENKGFLKGILSSINPFGGGGKLSLSFTTERTETASMVSEYLMIDFSSLKTGQYELEVRVTDLQSPTHASASSIFLLILTPGLAD